MTLKGGRVATVTHPISLAGPRTGGYAMRGRQQRPAVALADRLRALRPELPFLYGVDLLDPDLLPRSSWHRPADVLDAMFAAGGRHLSLSPAVSAARITTSLAYAVLGRPTVGLVMARRAPQVGPDSLLLRLDPDGLVEQAAVGDPAVAMLPHDPMSGHADARVLPDDPALVGWLADRVLATLAPLIEDLHRRTRFGVVPMWNLAADSALGPSTVVPLLAGFEQRSGRRVATAVVHALVERGAPIRRRGTTEAVTTSRGPALAPVRGSCCLHYRDACTSAVDGAHPTAGTVCASCPLLPAGLRAERFADTLPERR